MQDSGNKKALKIVHIPFSRRNPYQKLLIDGLNAHGIDVRGAALHHLGNIAVLNVSLTALLCRHWKPDIIHLHWQSGFMVVKRSRFKSILKSILFILQLAIVKVLGVKLIWTVHNLKQHESVFPHIEKYFTKKLAQRSDIIVAHCTKAKEIIQDFFELKNADKIVIIPHGNYTDYYPNKTSKPTARKKLNLPLQKRTYLFLGEIRYYKGIMELIDAFKSLYDPSIQLVIAGRPHDETIKMELLEKTKDAENIYCYPNYVPDGDMDLYINAADIMVFPYRDIFTSGGILLALSFSKPVIAPALGCVPDTLRGSHNFIYEPTSRSGLADMLIKTSLPGLELERIGRANLSLAQAFSWRSVTNQMKAVYEGLF